MLKKISIVELKKICKKNGIKGYSKMKKAELEKVCLKLVSSKKQDKIKKQKSKKIETKKTSLELAMEIPADDAREIKKIMLEKFRRGGDKPEITFKKLKPYLKYNYVKLLILKYVRNKTFPKGEIIYNPKDMKFKDMPKINVAIYNFFDDVWLRSIDERIKAASRIYKKNPEIAIALSSVILMVKDYEFDDIYNSPFYREEFNDVRYYFIVYFG